MKLLKIILLPLFSLLCGVALQAQRVITYESGMGSRDPANSDVWVLFQKVKAMHEGMTLYADSATFDTKNNTFRAMRNVKIVISDTTTLYGDNALYDGSSRIADVWGDTVTLIDGRTILTTDLLSYDRNQSTASYFHWGHTVHDSSTLDSHKGYYHSDSHDIYLFDKVVLHDSNAWLYTDTLLYNTRSHVAEFISPTTIVSDSSTVYSEEGTYNSSSHDACSYRATRLTNGATRLTADTLFFNDNSEHGEAYGNVIIFDSSNNVTCYGQMGITDHKQHFSFVTDSALIVFVDEGDTLYMHADTIWAFNNDSNQFEAASAYRGVRIFRADAQAVCDSVWFSMPDSCVSLFFNPVVWYEDYQCSADTIECHFDSNGVQLVLLKNNMFAIEKVDAQKFNQVRGKNGKVFLDDSEPRWADILGSAQMVYYVTENVKIGEATEQRLVGVNIGVGSDMRIYFKNREPKRFSTFGNPDMKMYPPDQVPENERRMQGFEWRDAIRPHSPGEVWR